MYRVIISGLLFLALAACSNNNSDASSIHSPAGVTARVATGDGKITAPIAKTAQSCKAQGGSWQPVCMLGSEYCVLSYADAGKSCTDSSQCQGKCLVVSAKIQPTGQCQLNNNPCGCFSSMENGQALPGLCID